MKHVKSKTVSPQVKRSEEKLNAVENIVNLVISAGSPDEEKAETLRALRAKVLSDSDFSDFGEAHKFKTSAIEYIDDAIDFLEDSPCVKKSPRKAMGNDSLIDNGSVYNPTNQTLTPKAMLKWQAMQIINMYCWFGMPCVVSIAYDSGLSVRVYDITYEYIQYLKDDMEMDVVLFTDGNRATIVKEG